MSEAAFVTRAGGATNVGSVRRNNEDSFLISPPVFLVADGMGGHSRGKEASEAVAKVFEQFADRDWFPIEELASVVVACHEVVMDVEYEGAAAPGSTLAGVATAVHDQRPCWFAFNVGDSRIYRLRRGKLEQISVDHSRRQELLDAGIISPGQRSAEDHVITRAIGAGSGDYLADQWLFLAAPGDRILLCSDGLTGEVDDVVIKDQLASAAEPQAVAEALIELALQHGGRDNVTVVVVDAVEVTSPHDFADTLAEAQTVPISPTTAQE